MGLTVTGWAASSLPLARLPRAVCRAWVLAFSLAWLGGCAVAPSHSGLQPVSALPPLLPVRSFVADLDASGAFQISPDGKLLMWSARIGLGPGLFVKDLATGLTRQFAVRGIGVWARDSRHVLIHMDANGDENTHLMSLDVQADAPALKDLTPFAGARSTLYLQLDDSLDLLVQSNRRDPKVYDLYRHVRATGELRLVAQNPGDVALWLADGQGQLTGRASRRGGQWVFETPDGPPGATWRARFRVDFLQSVVPLVAAPDGTFFWALSDRGRDKLALVRLFLDGSEEVVFADPRVDVGQVVFSPRRHVPLAVSLDPDVQEWHFLDPAFGAIAQRLKGSGPSRLANLSMSDDEGILVASTLRQAGGAHVLYRRSDDSVQPLAAMQRSRWQARSDLPQTQPLSFKSRDGLALHGYLTLPVVAQSGSQPQARPLPAVVYVHGGPWARDWHLGGDAMVDFLANRGYAVLQVNYRGSTGYGRAFRDAGRGEFAAHMQTDLIDGLDELVAQGIVDPRRVAIMGASYGGYASLVGMTFTPGRFACGISTVGMSDLADLIEQAPPYWEMSLPMWLQFVGDPADPAQREQMRQRSPLYRAASASGPILLMHGRQDPRVKLVQSQRMAQALQAAGKPVELQIFDKAGHGFYRWQDRMREFRLIEDFLAPCLGGRSGGFDLFEIGTWLL
jgi:dipeptidyl aminopeptidase/acylaminoacyl peptidase